MSASIIVQIYRIERNIHSNVMNTENIHYALVKFKLLCRITIQAQLRLCHETFMNIIKKNEIQQHDYLHPYDKGYLNTFIVLYLNPKLNYH